MTKTDLMEAIRGLIKKNGRATRAYLYDFFPYMGIVKNESVSRNQIDSATEQLIREKKIAKTTVGRTILYHPC